MDRKWIEKDAKILCLNGKGSIDVENALKH
jgi:hypothetical protein